MGNGLFDYPFFMLTDPDLRLSWTIEEERALPGVKHIYFNEDTGHTIVVWDDGTKTSVHCGENEEFSTYTGFCAAVAKKLFGSTSAVQKLISDKGTSSAKKKAQKPAEKPVAKEEKKPEKPMATGGYVPYSPSPWMVDMSVSANKATTANSISKESIDDLLKKILSASKSFKTGGGSNG